MKTLLRGNIIWILFWVLLFSAHAEIEVPDVIGQSVMKYETKNISISVSNVDIKNVIQAFSKQTGINVVVAEGIEGKISLVLKDVNAVQALSSILGTKDYSWYAQDENTIVITASKVSHTFALKYASAKEIFESLSKIMGKEGDLSLHEGSNSIVVNGTTAVILKMYHALKELDVLPRQVLVSTKIIELNVDNESNLGVIVSYTTGGTRISTQGLANSTTPQGIAGSSTTAGKGMLTTYINNSSNLSAALNALESRSDFNLIASPRIIASNNREAQIHVGEKLGYKLTTTSSSGLTQESVQFLDVGTRLVFTPRISLDGYVTLQIKPEKSSGQVIGGIPNTKTAETSTEVTVQDGNTIVIGGLIETGSSEINQGIPVFKDIPILGMLFRNKNEDISKKELIVFMTPQILTEALKKTLEEEAKTKEEEVQKSEKSTLDAFI